MDFYSFDGEYNFTLQDFMGDYPHLLPLLKKTCKLEDLKQSLRGFCYNNKIYVITSLQKNQPKKALVRTCFHRTLYPEFKSPRIFLKDTLKQRNCYWILDLEERDIPREKPTPKVPIVPKVEIKQSKGTRNIRDYFDRKDKE